MDGFALGCRVRDVADGTRATVKYIGPVAAAKNKTELWLGVEWDKTGRGKHDGSCVDEVTFHFFHLRPISFCSDDSSQSVSRKQTFID